MPTEIAAGGAAGSRIEIYLDGSGEPLAVYTPPAYFELETSSLEDGRHELVVVATDRSGRRGIRRIPFEVRNGPGIAVSGLRSGDVVEGRLSVLVNAYGGAYEENWEPSRAETPAPIPTWVWVLLLLIVAWSIFYTARQWSPSGPWTDSPTYSGWQDGSGSTPGQGAATRAH
ncbi:MAG: cytochrome C [Gemmatimonadales bacterium]